MEASHSVYDEIQGDDGMEASHSVTTKYKVTQVDRNHKKEEE